jgi:hypothetical protein
MVIVAGGVGNLRFDDNILVGNVRPDQFHLQCVTFSDDSAVGVTSMNHNLYFQLDGSQALVNRPDGTWNMGEWGDYLASTGWDVDSPDPQDPRFVDAEGGDFNLLAGSPAIDVGSEPPGSGRTTDFLGNPIVGIPDIGAVEFQP